MRAMSWYALPSVGLLAIASGCAGARAERAESPTARSVSTAQADSEEAIKRAADAQKRATEAGERVADAQAEVSKQQDRLAQAQEKLRQEQVKAEQAQQEAMRAMRESTQQAQQSQQQAAQALATQGEYVQRGQQTFSGQVTQASAEQIVVTPQAGKPMTFRVTERTRVQVDGRESSAADIQRGGDARVAYEVSGTEPTATVVQVITGRVGGERTAPSGTGTGGATPSAPQERSAPAYPPQGR